MSNRSQGPESDRATIGGDSYAVDVWLSTPASVDPWNPMNNVHSPDLQGIGDTSSLVEYILEQMKEIVEHATEFLEQAILHTERFKALLNEIGMIWRHAKLDKEVSNTHGEQTQR